MKKGIKYFIIGASVYLLLLFALRNYLNEQLTVIGNQTMYEEVVQEFIPVDVGNLEKESFTNQFVYIGRPTCIFCQSFVKKIHALPHLSPNQIRYYDTTNEENKKEFLRYKEKYGLKGVPSFLYYDHHQVAHIYDARDSLEDFVNQVVE